jgi:hypothetical protein
MRNASLRRASIALAIGFALLLAPGQTLHAAIACTDTHTVTTYYVFGYEVYRSESTTTTCTTI